MSKGVWMDPDMNKYDVEHVVTAHPDKTEAKGIAPPWGHIRQITSRPSCGAPTASSISGR